MKNKINLLILSIFCSMSMTYALDNNLFRKEFKPTYGDGNSYKSFSESPPTQLTPRIDNRVQQQLRDFSQDSQNSPRYNSSCQFGVCMPGGPGNVYSPRFEKTKQEY